MNPARPPSRAFRVALRRELAEWRAEGLVDEAVAGRLAARYGLAEPDLAGPGLLPVYVLGALLVLAGLASLVAWHWEELPRAAKLALIGVSVGGAHLAGDRLRRGGRHPLLGEAVTLFASLVFGVGIVLVAAIFDVKGPWYGAFGGFAVGAVAAGLLLDSTATLVAAALGGGGVWAAGFAAAQPGPLRAALVPFAVAAPLLGLSLWRRSPVLLAASSLGLLVSATAAGGNQAWPLVALLAGTALLAASLLGDVEGARAGWLRWIALPTLAAVGFLTAFRGAARMFTVGLQPPRPPWGAGAVGLVLPALAAVLLVALALSRPGRPATLRMLLGAVGVTVAAALLGARLGSWPVVAVASSALVAVIALERISAGITGLQRVAFWSGLLLATALFLARFLEIERLLWLKGLGFIACGVAVTWAAVRFERRRAGGRHGA